VGYHKTLKVSPTFATTLVPERSYTPTFYRSANLEKLVFIQTN